MSRTITPNGAGNATFQEKAIDVDGDTMTVDTVELDAVDGTAQTGGARTPSWLTFAESFIAGSPSESVIDVILQNVETNLTLGSTYTFLFEVSDSVGTTSRTVDVDVREPLTFGSNLGTKLFIADPGNNDVESYTLSTPFDGSTASVANSFSLSSFVSSGPFGIITKPDGTKFWIVGSSLIQGFEFISGPFDLSSGANKIAGVSANANFASSISFKPDGSRLFLLLGDEVRQFDLSTPWDITTKPSTPDATLSLPFTDAKDFTFQTFGLTMYIMNGLSGSDTVEFAGLSTPWDISTANSFSNVDVSSNVFGGTGLTFNNDGTKMYVFESGEEFFEYDLSTAWDPTSKTFVGLRTLEANAFVNGVTFN